MSYGTCLDKLRKLILDAKPGINVDIIFKHRLIQHIHTQFVNVGRNATVSRSVEGQYFTISIRKHDMNNIVCYSVDDYKAQINANTNAKPSKAVPFSSLDEALKYIHDNKRLVVHDILVDGDSDFQKSVRAVVKAVDKYCIIYDDLIMLWNTIYKNNSTAAILLKQQNDFRLHCWRPNDVSFISTKQEDIQTFLKRSHYPNDMPKDYDSSGNIDDWPLQILIDINNGFDIVSCKVEPSSNPHVKHFLQQALLRVNKHVRPLPVGGALHKLKRKYIKSSEFFEDARGVKRVVYLRNGKKYTKRKQKDGTFVYRLIRN